MDASSLLEVMAQETAGQRMSVLESAHAESKRMLAAAREEAARRRSEALQLTEAELAEAAQRSRERAEAEAAMAIRTTKDTITDEILSAVSEELERIVKGPGFPAILEALLEELLRSTAAGEVVLAPPDSVAHCRRWLAANGYDRLEVRGMDTLEDGVAVQDAQRSFRVTNTLSARLAGQEARLRKLCLKRLIPDGPRPAEERPE